MTENFSQPQTYGRPAARGFGRMLVLSLAAHLTAVAFFAADLFPGTRRQVRPLYYVDLVNLPVADPQAGRPDARPPAEKPAPPAPPSAPPASAVVAKPPAPQPPLVKPQPPPVPKSTPKAPAPPSAPKATPKPEVQTADAYAQTASAIEQMRQQRELAERLAALKASRQSAAAPVEAPVGMPTGKGKEVGVDEQLWIQKFLKESWNLSKYQVTRRDLTATARLVYDAGGQLVDYRIVRSSGDSNFDESVRRAILKAKQLPFRPERRLELEDVEFNLKDLLD